ncbi:MAG: hydrogenase expression protein HupH [Gammaproteobacteria bacterium]|jgi:allantoin racemase|nr:hydrogenase expression protein HupH [Gammaproteobacteria bacterium]
MHIRIILPIHNPDFFKEATTLLPAHLQTEGMTIDVVQPDMGPEFIMNRFEIAVSVPGTLQKIIEAEKDGVDAVVINCMGDPGLSPGRELVRIPVIGPTQIAMHVASTLGYKFAVIALNDSVLSFFEEQAKIFNLQDRLKAVIPLDLSVAHLLCDLEQSADAIYQKALIAIKNHRVDSIIMGCTGMFGCRERVQQKLLEAGYDVQVIDPLPLAVEYAAMLLRSKLSHSKLAYPASEFHEIPGYSFLK